MTPVETKVLAALAMDRSTPLGNSDDTFSRRALHVKVANLTTEPIPVVTAQLGSVINVYSESNSVVQNTETTVQSYTVAAGNVLWLKKISAAGTNVSEYKVKIDGITQEKLYSYFGGSLNVCFDFCPSGTLGLEVMAGQTITITAKHSRPYICDFSSKILASEVTA